MEVGRLGQNSVTYFHCFGCLIGHFVDVIDLSAVVFTVCVMATCRLCRQSSALD